MKVIIDIPQDVYEKIIKMECLPINKIYHLIKYATPITDDATNGDIIKAMFPDVKTWKYDEEMIAVQFEGIIGVKLFTLEWWNAKYKGVE